MCAVSEKGPYVVLGTCVWKGPYVVLGTSLILPIVDSTTPFGKWTPDGRGIAFIESTDTKNIWVQPIDGGAPHPLTTFTDKTIDDFTWSPDGKRLAITRRTTLADMVLIKGSR